MREDVRGSLTSRLSWDEVHRLEVLMRMRSSAMGRRGGSSSTCPECGAPLAGDAVRIAGVRVHPGCLALSARA
jgi:hypothetical protein